MPSLMRFLKSILTLALAITGGVLALAYLVPPHTRVMTEPVDSPALHAPPPTQIPPSTAQPEPAR
jgi:hypothetical protein